MNGEVRQSKSIKMKPSIVLKEAIKEHQDEAEHCAQGAS